MSRALFFYGTLCHLPLLELVLGRDRRAIAHEHAYLPDHHVRWVQDQPFPMIESHAGARAEGLLVSDLSTEDLARLQFYEGGFDYDLSRVSVSAAHGVQTAEVFFPDPARWQAGADWSLSDWERDWGAISLSAAREVMAQYGRKSARDVAHLLPFLRARGWAHELARRPAPAERRSTMRARDIALERLSDGYAGFFRYDTFRISYPRFDGTQSAQIERGAFVAYDAALVLPYDPQRDEVLLIEQMRYGPLMRGDPLPWILEPIAGLVDAGEPPIETARREAVEEAGLALDDIRPMLKTYASPGYSTEFFHCFLGVCDLGGVTQGVHGLDSENEDIRTHILSFDAAMALVDSGEINGGPMAMMLLWLARERDGLRS